MLEKTGTVTISAEGVCAEGFTFDMDKAPPGLSASELARQWAIERLKETGTD